MRNHVPANRTGEIREWKGESYGEVNPGPSTLGEGKEVLGCVAIPKLQVELKRRRIGRSGNEGGERASMEGGTGSGLST